ncbi:MAG: tetratricopeptide repeat protein [Bacteroidales bacterium]|nr:tetratricopeptide repeat protein [Bacteroidales bacterium]
MKKDRFKDYDKEVRDLVLDFERTVLKGQQQFFDVDELEIIIDYYLEVNDQQPLDRAVGYAEYLYPDSTEVRIRRAHQMIAHQQFDPAVDMLLKLRKEEPDNTDIAYTLGVAYGAKGDSQKAIAYYEEALTDGWMPGRIYGNIAEEYYKLGDLPKAIAYYEAALSEEPADEVTLFNYYDTCFQAHCTDQAMKTLQDITQRDPYNKYAWYTLACVLLALGQDDKAIDALQFAIAIDNGFVDAYVRLSQIYHNRGDLGQAVGTMLRVLEHTDRRDDVYRTVGSIYAHAGNFLSALAYLRKAIDSNPTDAESFASMAVCYMNTNDMPAALAAARKALNLEDALSAQHEDEGNSEVFHGVALVYDVAGYFDKASECYERMLIAGNCTEPQCQDYTLFLYHHQVYDILIEFGEESLALYPHDNFYSTYLAAAYFYTNRYNKARKMLPDVQPELLDSICPQLGQHPLLGPLIPRPDPPLDL